MTTKELIEKLQQFPQDMEVWSFDYGDDQGYPILITEVPDNYLMLGIDHPVVMLR